MNDSSQWDVAFQPFRPMERPAEVGSLRIGDGAPEIVIAERRLPFFAQRTEQQVLGLNGVVTFQLPYRIYKKRRIKA